MPEAFSWAHKIWSRLLVPSFPARSRRIQLPENLGQIAVARTCFHLRKWRTHVAMGCDVIASDSIPLKIPKCYFLKKYAVLKFHIYNRCLLYVISKYDTNNYNFESFDSFSIRQKKIWYGFRYGVRRYGLWFSYPTVAISVSLGEVTTTLPRPRCRREACAVYHQTN